ncbi:MAG TPA: class I SAM-dependent RNA methyltransferase [Sporichthyaceae bacterium]|jgi:tRNA/tmRNA/rRNA uracil-C5-methylase (TrmA/RlmC/RlmD family)|nr:class I SAM-dependent RNA methyltransferase [Sporichthyaceae bacterium]
MDERATRARRRTGAYRRVAERSNAGDAAGQVLELTVGNPAHGGSCVARHGELVVFVRHALPGEEVRARVTEGKVGDRFWRADAIEVLVASPDRVAPACEYAGPGGCGGCDWQHADLAAQRRIKAQVLAEQLHRLAGLDVECEVEALPGAADGSGWRTRVRFAVDAAGRAGLRRHRSHEVVPIAGCFIAHPDVAATGVLRSRWTQTAEVQVTVAGSGERAVVVRAAENPRGVRAQPSAEPLPDPETTVLGYWPPGVSAAERVVETVLGRSYAVPAGGFWQVHPQAAQTLVEAVRAVLDPHPGDVLLDLYSGVGLFAGALASAVAPGGEVHAVESDAAAVAAARDNLLGIAGVSVVADRVDRALADGLPVASLVVLDPPRSGAGREVVEAVAARGPRRIAYVACDPATLARDLRIFADCGYRLTSLRAFDLFPHTHHLEALAGLEPA